MPKKGHHKNSKKMKRQNPSNEMRRAEETNLQQMLAERNLFRPGMKITEMRELCAAVEQSMLDHELHQKINRLNRSYAEGDITILEDPVLDSSLKLSSIISPPTRSPEQLSNVSTSSTNSCKIELPNASIFSHVKSPNVAQASGMRSCGRTFDAYDSDSDGCYSPEFPGRNCRVKHVVKVEVHPVPRDINGAGSDHCYDDDKESQVAPPVSPLEQKKPLTVNGWDTIDELH